MTSTDAVIDWEKWMRDHRIYIPSTPEEKQKWEEKIGWKMLERERKFRKSMNALSEAVARYKENVSHA